MIRSVSLPGTRRTGVLAVLVALLATILGACVEDVLDTTRTPTAAASPTSAPGDGGVVGEASGTIAAAQTQVVFTRIEFDEIGPGRLAALRAIDGVVGVAAPRADDVAVIATSRRDGTPVDDLPADFKISLGGVVDDARIGLGLGTGEVAMTSAGLRLRDLDVGGRVVFAGGLEATVTTLVEDPALDRYEIVVAAVDAAALGFRPRQRAILSLAPDAGTADVATAAADVLGEHGIVQVRPADRSRLVLSLPETKARFGEFAFRDLPGRDIEQDATFTDDHITRRDVPFFGLITCHEAVFDPLVAALQQVRDEGLGEHIDPSLYGGCWTARRINRNANLSRHAWGIAIDINVDVDAPGLGPVPADGVIAAFREHGFVWGGDYPIPDNHHFEYLGDPD